MVWYEKALTRELSGGAVFLYRLVRIMVVPLVWLLYSVKVEGRGNIPRKGGVILASNHPRLLDPGMVGFACPRPVSFGAKSEFFRWKGVGFITKPLFTALRQFPVDRTGGRSGLAFLKAAVHHVDARHEVLGIFPEGWLSPPGRLHRLKSGVARIACETGAPVVLIAVAYGERSWRTCGRQPVTVKVAPPRWFGPQDEVAEVVRLLDKELQSHTKLPTTGEYASRDA